MGAPRLERLDRNFVINGNFEFSQRAGLNVVNSTGYVLDRFRTSTAGLVGNEYEQSWQPQDTPFGSGGSIKLRCANTIAPGPGVVSGFIHAFHGYSVQPLKNKKIGITWYTKSNHDANYSVNLFTTRDGVNFDSYVSDFSVVAANGWERHDVIIDITGHDPRLSNAQGMSITWDLIQSDRDTSVLNVWNPENGSAPLRSITGQDNFFDTVGNEIQFAKVMVYEVIDEDSLVSDNVYIRAGRDYFEEKDLCKKFYQKSYSNEVNPGTVTNNGRYAMGTFVTNSGVIDYTKIDLEVEMRAVPIATVYAYNTGNQGQALYVTTTSSSSVHPVELNLENSTKSITFRLTGTVGGARGSCGYVVFHWTAEAEL